MSVASRRVAFAAGVAAIAFATIAVARSSSPPEAARAGHGVVVAAPRPVAGVRRLRPVGRAQARRLARRFAAAYAEWDAGDRSRRTADRLEVLATPEVLGAVEAGGRPTARPAKALALDVLASERGAGGYWVALGGRGGRRWSHVATVLVAATADGPRVTALVR